MQRNTLDIDITTLRKQFQLSFNPEKPLYFKEDMILAVARKKKSRMQKSSDFNCVVIEDQDKDELNQILENLNNHRDAFGQNQRFQILFHYHRTHWIALDCRFRNNQFDFIAIDAAIYGEGLKEAIAAITNAIPDANITYLALNKNTKIQRCYENCGTFALDILFGLSKIDAVYELIAPVASTPKDSFALKFEKKIENKQLKSITIAELPVELGCLLRNMHSISTLEALTKEKHYQSSSHTLLATYFRAHTAMISDRESNVGVDYKRRNIKNKTMAYYKTLNNQDITSLLIKNENYNPCLMHEETRNQDNSEPVTSFASADTIQDEYNELTLTPGYIGQSLMSFFSDFYGLFFSAATDKKAHGYDYVSSIKNKS